MNSNDVANQINGYVPGLEKRAVPEVSDADLEKIAEGVSEQMHKSCCAGEIDEPSYLNTIKWKTNDKIREILNGINWCPGAKPGVVELNGESMKVDSPKMRQIRARVKAMEAHKKELKAFFANADMEKRFRGKGGPYGRGRKVSDLTDKELRAELKRRQFSDVHFGEVVGELGARSRMGKPMKKSVSDIVDDYKVDKGCGTKKKKPMKKMGAHMPRRGMTSTGISKVSQALVTRARDKAYTSWRSNRKSLGRARGDKFGGLPGAVVDDWMRYNSKLARQFRLFNTRLQSMQRGARLGKRLPQYLRQHHVTTDAAGNLTDKLEGMYMGARRLAHRAGRQGYARGRALRNKSRVALTQINSRRVSGRSFNGAMWLNEARRHRQGGDLGAARVAVQNYRLGRLHQAGLGKRLPKRMRGWGTTDKAPVSDRRAYRYMQERVDAHAYGRGYGKELQGKTPYSRANPRQRRSEARYLRHRGREERALSREILADLMSRQRGAHLGKRVPRGLIQSLERMENIPLRERKLNRKRFEEHRYIVERALAHRLGRGKFAGRGWMQRENARDRLVNLTHMQRNKLASIRPLSGSRIAKFTAHAGRYLRARRAMVMTPNNLDSRWTRHGWRIKGNKWVPDEMHRSLLDTHTGGVNRIGNKRTVLNSMQRGSRLGKSDLLKFTPFANAYYRARNSMNLANRRLSDSLMDTKGEMKRTGFKDHKEFWRTRTGVFNRVVAHQRKVNRMAGIRGSMHVDPFALKGDSFGQGIRLRKTASRSYTDVHHDSVIGAIRDPKKRKRRNGMMKGVPRAMRMYGKLPYRNTPKSDYIAYRRAAWAEGRYPRPATRNQALLEAMYGKSNAKRWRAMSRNKLADLMAQQRGASLGKGASALEKLSPGLIRRAGRKARMEVMDESMGIAERMEEMATRNRPRIMAAYRRVLREASDARMGKRLPRGFGRASVPAQLKDNRIWNDMQHQGRSTERLSDADKYFLHRMKAHNSGKYWPGRYRQSATMSRKLSRRLVDRMSGKGSLASMQAGNKLGKRLPKRIRDLSRFDNETYPYVASLWNARAVGDRVGSHIKGKTPDAMSRVRDLILGGKEYKRKSNKVLANLTLSRQGQQGRVLP